MKRTIAFLLIIVMLLINTVTVLGDSGNIHDKYDFYYLGFNTSWLYISWQYVDEQFENLYKSSVDGLFYVTDKSTDKIIGKCGPWENITEEDIVFFDTPVNESLKILFDDAKIAEFITDIGFENFDEWYVMPAFNIFEGYMLCIKYNNEWYFVPFMNFADSYCNFENLKCYSIDELKESVKSSESKLIYSNEYYLMEHAPYSRYDMGFMPFEDTLELLNYQYSIDYSSDADYILISLNDEDGNNYSLRFSKEYGDIEKYENGQYVPVGFYDVYEIIDNEIYVTYTFFNKVLNENMSCDFDRGTNTLYLNCSDYRFMPDAMSGEIYNFWGKDEVAYLYSYNYINGDSDKIRVNDNITRAEFLYLIMNTFDITTSDSIQNPYTDVDINDWYYDCIIKATSLGIVSGHNNSFNPNDPITREEMCKIISLVCSVADFDEVNIIENSFADSDKISPWAVDYVNETVSRNFVKGNDNNMFLPQNNLTRGEAFVIIYRIITQGAIL